MSGHGNQDRDYLNGRHMDPTPPADPPPLAGSLDSAMTDENILDFAVEHGLPFRHMTSPYCAVVGLPLGTRMSGTVRPEDFVAAVRALLASAAEAMMDWSVQNVKQGSLPSAGRAQRALQAFPGFGCQDEAAKQRFNELLVGALHELARAQVPASLAEPCARSLQLYEDALTMAMRLFGESDDTFAPETIEVMKRWRPLVQARLAGEPCSIDALQTDAYAQGRADEQEELASVLPGTTYMDPPHGGAPTILEQLQRQAKDAARWVWTEQNAAEPLLQHRFGYSYAQVEHWTNEQNRLKLRGAVDQVRGAP